LSGTSATTSLKKKGKKNKKTRTQRLLHREKKKGILFRSTAGTRDPALPIGTKKTLASASFRGRENIRREKKTDERGWGSASNSQHKKNKEESLREKGTAAQH